MTQSIKQIKIYTFPFIPDEYDLWVNALLDFYDYDVPTGYITVRTINGEVIGIALGPLMADDLEHEFGVNVVIMLESHTLVYGIRDNFRRFKYDSIRGCGNTLGNNTGDCASK